MTPVLLVTILFGDNPALWPLPQSKFFCILLGPRALTSYYSTEPSPTLHTNRCPQDRATHLWTSTHNPFNLSGLQGPTIGCAKGLGQGP